MRRLIPFILVFLCSITVHAQNYSVSGVVSDATANDPLPGVSVIVKNTGQGAQTDFNGNYVIDNVAQGSILVFSYIGYESQEVVVDKATINVSLVEGSEKLDEIVIVGYGSQRKSDVVGSVASIDVEEATTTPTTNVSEMLRGKASGVQINLGDARPGGGSNIVIRGSLSVDGDNSPFFVVDGLPYDDINDISPDDIASIEVLKDASATAIYGSRASNGVILVTTKSGKEGKVSVNYHGYTTVQSLTKNFNAYSASEFIDLRREANRNRVTGDWVNDVLIFDPFEIESILSGDSVDWPSITLNDAVIQSHSLSVSAGSENTQLYASANYFTQEGIVPSSGFDRATFKLNLNQKITEKLSFKTIVNFQSGEQSRETGGLNFTTISPLAQPFDENGNVQKFHLGPTNTNVNPLWNQIESEDLGKTNLTDINLNATYKFSNTLSYTLRTFLRNRNSNRGLYRTSLHADGDEGIDGVGVIFNTLFKQSLIENIINYTPEMNENHSLDITGVQALDQTRTEHSQLDKSGFISDALGFNGPARNLNNNPRDVNDRTLLSYLARIRYSYLDKYLFQFTTRADGSSVFAEDNKWGVFPAGSFAWKAHQEPFLENVDAINELKIRVSYGLTGNQSINSSQTLGVADNLPYTFGGNTYSGALSSNQLPNPDLKWESTATFNTGVDFKLFDNLFEGTIEYYNSKTTDLLLPRAVLPITGFEVTRFNVGEVENKGLELTLTTNIFRENDFKWSLGITASGNRNEILKLTGEVDENGVPIPLRLSDGRVLAVGQSINNIWLPKYDGIFQVGDDIASSGTPLAQPGDVRVIDQDLNGQIDERDNVYITTDPDWFGSITNTFKYKGFDLFADIFIVEGATKLNSVLADGEVWKGRINGIRSTYYTPEFPSTEYPRPKADTHVHLSSFAVRDASYIRLRTLNLGYNIPESDLSKIGLNSAKVYVSGTNLLTESDFRSYSPEQNPTNGDATSFPETRNITFGVKLGF